MSAAPLHITVTALSMVGDFNDISHEVRLVKAALLYADHVTLASPKATLISAIGGLLFQPPQERRKAVREIVSSQPDTKAVVDIVETLRRQPKGSLKPDHLIMLRKAEHALEQAEEQMMGIIERMVSNTSVADLAEALDAGVLTLDPMGLDQDSFTTDAMLAATQKLLVTVVGPAANTFPMFDDSAGNMVRLMIEEGHMPEAKLLPATQAGLAARYIEHLEAFPDAEMSVVLEARAQLSAPLIRFRSGLSEMAGSLSATPLDDDFDAAADDAYRREVAPALDELGDLAEQQRLLPALRKQVTGGSAGAVLKASLALAATTMAGLPDLAQLAAAATVATDVAVGIATSRREAAATMKANKFLWLYEAPGALGAR